MKIGLQVPSFTWPGGAAEIGPRLAEIAKTKKGFQSRRSDLKIILQTETKHKKQTEQDTP